MRRMLAIIGLACVASLLVALPASAEPMPHTSGNAAPASRGPNVTCAKSTVTATHTALGVFTASTTGEPCTVQLSSWSVPDSYDGKGYDASAKPQVLADRVVATLTSETSTVSVKLPKSRWCQIDFRAANGTYIYGRIVECHPPIIVTPKPPLVCKAHQHLSHGKCVTSSKPKPHTTPAARVRLTSASVDTLPRTGGAPWLLGLLGCVALAGGLSLRFARWTRSARRH